MIQNYPIENTFKDMCNSTPRNNYYYEKYIVFKSVLYEKIYPYVPESKPGYTEHSHKHIDGVLLQIDRLCKERIDIRYIDDPNYINLCELYLLLMSTIFHDAAMIVEEREVHSEINKIIRLFDSIILSDEEKDWIKCFVKCHQSSSKIENEIPMREKMILNWNVHPQFIAAMLRLADELDEHKLRMNEIGILLGKLPKNQAIFHEFSRTIDGINPKPSEGKINIEISIQKNNVFKKYKKGKGEKIFIEEVIDRVNKINLERKYCMDFTLHFLEYKSVDLKLFIKNESKMGKEIRFIFDDRKDSKDFWETNKIIIERYCK